MSTGGFSGTSYPPSWLSCPWVQDLSLGPSGVASVFILVSVFCLSCTKRSRFDVTGHRFARIVRIVTLIHVVSHVTSYRMSIIFSILYSIYRLLLDDGSVCFIPLLMEVAPRNEQSANSINSRDTRRW